MTDPFNMRLILTTIVYLMVVPVLFSQPSSDTPNVLFISVDDMANWTGYNDHPDVLTPNLDRLANRGAIFTEAYCASPICAPSRTAVLSGMRPETTKSYHNKIHFDKNLPGVTALPQYFRDNGYVAYGSGKVFHPNSGMEEKAFDEYGPGAGVVGTPFTHEQCLQGNLPATIKEEDWPGKGDISLPINGISLIDRPQNQYSTFDWGPLDCTDDDMPDGKAFNWAIDKIKKGFDKPFFLAVGAYRPHQPLLVPKKYFEMYDEDKISLPPTLAGDMNDLPETASFYSYAAWTSGLHKTVTAHNQWRQGILGYLASITFADALVGKVLDALDNSPYADNTVIVLWSDHGWHLGEKEHWGKHTAWKQATQVPFIIVPPRNHKLKGFNSFERISAPVSLVDIYPTLIDLCGLPIKEDLDGKSLKPLINDPKSEWTEASVTTLGRGSHAVTSREWAYIHYFDGSEELYYLPKDPNQWFNLASDHRYSDIKDKLVKHIPVDDDIKQYVRWGNWKAVISKDDKLMLFNIAEGFGISEQFDLADKNPSVIKKITTYLKEKNISDRHVMIKSL